MIRHDGWWHALDSSGVQGTGKAYLLQENELDEAFRWYHTTYVPMEKKSFTGNSPYHFYKILPDHFYVLDSDAVTDKRVEVFLK